MPQSPPSIGTLKMIKKILIMFVSFFSFVCFSSTFAACPEAAPVNTAGFCSSFKLAAQCHCVSAGLPKGMCMSMKTIFDRMNSMFGSVQRACEYQRDTSTQNCVDAWLCYRSGGLTSQNELCNGTGSACE